MNQITALSGDALEEKGRFLSGSHAHQIGRYLVLFTPGRERDPYGSRQQVTWHASTKIVFYSKGYGWRNTYTPAATAAFTAVLKAAKSVTLIGATA